MHLVDDLQELRSGAVCLLELDHVDELLVDVHTADLGLPLFERGLQELLDLEGRLNTAYLEADITHDAAMELTEAHAQARRVLSLQREHVQQHTVVSGCTGGRRRQPAGITHDVIPNGDQFSQQLVADSDLSLIHI